MRNLRDIITESSGKNMFNVVQFESDNESAYSTFDAVEARKKYKMGFMQYHEDGEFISILAYKNSDAIIYYEDEDCGSLKVGESIYNNDKIITRIW